jgi:hypothetical protein
LTFPFAARSHGTLSVTWSINAWGGYRGHFSILDIFWLKDESLEASDNLTDPDVTAQGWRIPIFSQYENVVKIEEVK